MLRSERTFLSALRHGMVSCGSNSSPESNSVTFKVLLPSSPEKIWPHRALMARLSSMPAAPAPTTTTWAPPSFFHDPSSNLDSTASSSSAMRLTRSEMGLVGMVNSAAPGVSSSPRVADPISKETASYSTQVAACSSSSSSPQLTSLR